MLMGVTACMRNTRAPVVHYGQGSGAGSAGVHAVTEGDTLYSLSQRYRLPMRDMVELNHIKPPFKLYVGQRVKLPPPHEYTVQLGDTLYGVSRLFGVNSAQVARLNNMNSPYVLHIGQVLRLPSVIQKTQSVEVSTKMTRVEKVMPSRKPVLSQISDNGVPVPGEKPVSHKKVRVSKVTTRAPKRSSGKFLKPVNGRIVSGFGSKKSGLYNDGVNIAVARGTSVKAAENGVVVYTGSALKGSGNLVLVRHENQWMSAYAHLDSIGVKKGQVLKRGSVLGKVGSTGSVSTPQLHFELRRGTSALNPVRYM